VLLQKTELTPLPLLTEVERKIKDQIIASLVIDQGRFPAALRMNPCTIIAMPSSQWYAFQTIVYGEDVMIPVITDQSVAVGEILLVHEIDEQATKSMEAVRVTG